MTTTIIQTLQKNGIKAAVISVDLTEEVPVYRVALSKDGADCDGLHAASLSLAVAIANALE